MSMKGAFDRNVIVRHELDSELNQTSTDLPMPPGLVWIAKDLDLDGNIELVIQRGNGNFDIHSAPSWIQRSHHVVTGVNVIAFPVAVNLDSDPYLEVYLTGPSLGDGSVGVVIQYDELLDTFVVTDNVALPDGAAGPAAFGDFDEDGNVEIIVGYFGGHLLMEYAEDSLRVIGPVGLGYYGNNGDCSAVRPKPDGVLYPLLGHSSATHGYVYELLRAIADNEFETVEVFEEQTGWSGNQPSFGLDTDCDGLDELIMMFYPEARVLQWDPLTQSFAVGCVWDANAVGTFTEFYGVDLNQDGIPEWGTVDQNYRFQVFEDLFCATPANGIVSWWSLDDQIGGVATDVWGTNDGMWIGAPSVVPGKVSMALSFDGISDYIIVPDVDSLNLGMGDFSFEGWINTASATSLNPLAAKYDPAAVRGWVLSVVNGSRLQLNLYDGTSSTIQSEMAPLADGQWHHVAVSVDRDMPDGIRFHCDGVPAGSGDPTGHQGNIDNAADFLIGATSTVLGDTAIFEGALDEVAVYRTALESAAIRCIYMADDRGKCQPDTSCNCPFQADYDESGYLDALDFNVLIDVLFYGAPEITDPHCPSGRGDANTDGVPDALDLNILIEHLFFGGPGPVNPCDP